MSYYYFQILSSLITLLITACGGPIQRSSPPVAPPVATESQPPPAWVSEVTADTLPTLVIIEREASIEGNLPVLALLWAENGRIVDGRGSAAVDDDYVWVGRAAILDRYQLAVFPAPPPPLTAPELDDATLTVEGDSATLISHGDHWLLVQQDGRWWLQELVYSAPR